MTVRGSVGAAVTWARWLFPLAALAAGLYFFRDEMPFLGEAWGALRHASPGPVAAAVAASVASVLAMAAAMQQLMNIEGRITGFRRCASITLASNAWSTTVPGGPAISAWLTFRVHRSWGASPGLCGWFFVVSGALSTVWLVVIGVVAVAFLGAQLSVGALAGSLALAVGVSLALFWAARNPEVLRRGVRLVPTRVAMRLEKFIDEVAAVRMTGRTFALAAACSLANRLFDALTLYFAAWSVLGVHGGNISAAATVRAVALAFVMTKLAGAAQVTPGGVGTVETIAAATLVASGMTLVDATATTLVYRLVSFLLITAIGWVLYLLRYAGRGFMLGSPTPALTGGEGHAA